MNLKQYSLWAKIRLVIEFLRTKTISPKSLLIRFPIDIRGRKYIDFGSRLTTGRYCRLEASSSDGRKTMFLGYNVQINDYVHICAMEEVRIGNNVLIAGKVYISDNSHGSYKGNDDDASPEDKPMERAYSIKPVRIEDNVWIGEGVIILPGVKIGKGAIIGANSVVNKDVPSNVIAVGNPVRLIKRYNFDSRHWERIIAETH